jgi:O-antigen/teichoic acid export membrane protein
VTNFEHILKNTHYAFLSNSIRIISNFIVFVLIARNVEVEDFGKFTFSITFTTLFLYVVNFGIDRLIILEVSRDRNIINRYFGNVMTAKLLISLASVALICLIVNIMGYPADTRYLVYVFTIAMIMTSFAGVPNSVFKGIQRLEYEFYVACINNIFLLTFTITVLWLGHGVFVVAFVFLSSRFIGFLFSLYIYGLRVGKINFYCDLKFCNEMFKKALPFALLSCLTAILFDIDTVLISYLKGDKFVAYYQPAMKIIVSLTVIPYILDSSFFPLLSKLHLEKCSFQALGNRLITILFYIGSPLMIGTLVLADKIILFIYGQNYLPSIIVLRVLSIVLLLRFLMVGYEIVLIAIGKQRVILKILFCATSMNILMNIIIIPKFGIIGSAISAAVTHILIVISYMVALKRIRGTNLLKKGVSAILFFATLAGMIVYCFKYLELFVLISIYGVVYLSFSLIVMRNERLWIYERVTALLKGGTNSII